MGTLIVFLVLAGIVGAAVYSLYRDKRNHKGCCGDCCRCGRACRQKIP